MTISEWQTEVHKVARDHGWYDDVTKTPRDIASMLCNVHAEVSEALEDVRAGRMESSSLNSYSQFQIPIKPEGFPSELADIVIRVMDMAEWLGIDLEEQIKIKNEYNKTRGKRHGGKAL